MSRGRFTSRSGPEDANGNPITVIAAVNATPVTKIDTDFTATEIFDINTALGRNATQFVVILDGLNAIDVATSTDGIAFGNEHRMLVRNEVYGFNNINVDSIRVTHTGADSAYRIVAL